MDQAAIIGKRIVRLITIVVMPVQTDAAHTHETVISGVKPPSSAACKINVIGPAKEMSTAISPAFHADKDESCQALRKRCSNPNLTICWKNRCDAAQSFQ